MEIRFRGTKNARRMDTAVQNDPAELKRRIASRTARVGVIGPGYVGLPLARTFVQSGFPVAGFDTDPDKIERISAGRSYIKQIADETVRGMLEDGKFEPQTDFAFLAETDAILICVPTPLTADRQPDLSFVIHTAETVGKYLRPGQLVVLESTTFPGTTKEVLRRVGPGNFTPSPLEVRRMLVGLK